MTFTLLPPELLEMLRPLLDFSIATVQLYALLILRMTIWLQVSNCFTILWFYIQITMLVGMTYIIYNIVILWCNKQSVDVKSLFIT